MSIITAEGLPSANKLKQEGIEVFSDETEIKPLRPLSVVVVNLMPLKEITEQQILRLIGGSPLPVDIEFVYMSSYSSKNVSQDHLKTYYKTFEEIKDKKFDGLIITGAPIEHLAYEDVVYYEELSALTKWSETHATKRFFICWGAQFALHYYYGVEKYTLPEKLFGIYKYKVDEADYPIFTGFNDFYQVPVSRHTQIDDEVVQQTENLLTLTSNTEFGSDIIQSRDEKDLFILGHLEYDRYSLEKEYKRDIGRWKDIQLPANYYPEDDASQEPILSWRSHANLLFRNWLTELNKSVQ